MNLYLYNKYLLTFVLIAVALVLPQAVALAAPQKITYCHATSSTTNPYTKVTVPAGTAHEQHANDFVIPENGNCSTAPTPTNNPTPTSTPTDTPTITPTSTPTDTPTPTVTPSPTPAGCEIHDTNPVCPNALFLGNISGDTTSAPLSAMGADEAWYRVRINELSDASRYLSASITLQSPPGVDYDLYVRCLSCTNPTVLSSTNGAGHLDQMSIGHDDTFATDDSHDIFIEVRYFGSGVGAVCGNWTLTINGDVVTDNRSCN